VSASDGERAAHSMRARQTVTWESGASPRRSAPSVRGLDLELPARSFLAAVSWAGPTLDPDRLGARELLSLL
jgi:hypothetical protein